jgi:hypothetical protein
MSDRNTAYLPCPDCKRKEPDHRVEAYIPDEILEEYGVTHASKMKHADIYDCHDRQEYTGVDMPVCGDCGSSS